MAVPFSDFRAYAIKEPLIQHPGDRPYSKEVEKGEPSVGTIFGADSTATVPQEPNVEIFADSVKYNQGATSDAASVNGNKPLY